MTPLPCPCPLVNLRNRYYSLSLFTHGNIEVWLNNLLKIIQLKSCCDGVWELVGTKLHSPAVLPLEEHTRLISSCTPVIGVHCSTRVDSVPCTMESARESREEWDQVPALGVLGSPPSKSRTRFCTTSRLPSLTMLFSLLFRLCLTVINEINNALPLLSTYCVPVSIEKNLYMGYLI